MSVNQIYRTTISSGTYVAFAGQGTSGFIDAAGTSARFTLPKGLALNPTSNCLYVADHDNGAIRAINLTTSNVTTIAGCNGTRGNIDGPLGTNLLSNTQYVLYSAAYNMVYFSDAGGIKQVELTSGCNVVTTLISSNITGAKPQGLFILSNTLYYVPDGTGYLMSYSLTPPIPQRNPSAILYASNAHSWTLY